MDSYRRCTVPVVIRRLGTTPSPSAIGLVLAFVLTVSALTAAQAAHAISVEALAASPRNVAAGKVWLLVSSGLVVQSPLALSLLSFTLLALLTLFVCGSQVLWAAAFLGHVCSTLIVYATIGVAGLGDADRVRHVAALQDYGVSAIAAAWLGATAAVAWRRRGPRLMDKAPIVLSCLAVALFAWMLRGHLNVLDSEHMLAFGIGAALAGPRWKLAARPARPGFAAAASASQGAPGSRA